MKNSTIQIKINLDTKEKFFTWCKNQAINPSEWLRSKITEAIEKEDQ